jgi:pimeloyl-ACP methyl ester carboxylesterase
LRGEYGRYFDPYSPRNLTRSLRGEYGRYCDRYSPRNLIARCVGSAARLGGANPYATFRRRKVTKLPVRHVRTDLLDVAYHGAGPAGGQPVVLLHGFPYDIHSYVDVAPELARSGYRVIVPYLRGHGPTRFLDPDTPRSGQQAALGADVLALMDALDIPSAILAGYDWGGRAACVAAALRPDRVTGIVSVNGYLIQDISTAMEPLTPAREAGFWYFFYFLTQRGAAGLTAHRREIAEVIWRRNSPRWSFDVSDLDRAAAAFENPDYVEVVLHSYRHRLGQAEGAPAYAKDEAALAALPAITVPAVTLDGTADGNFPATDGSAGAAYFKGPRIHRQVADAGHNLPQEMPDAFANAVREIKKLASR